MLGLEPVIETEEMDIGGDSDEDDPEEGEKIRTFSDGWRSWTKCRAEWEEFDTPTPHTAFLANRKPLDAPLLLQGESPDTTESSSEHDTDAPTQRPKRRNEPTIQQTIELHTRGTHAYAALQGRSSEHVGSTSQASSQGNDTSDDNLEDRKLPLPTDNTGKASSTSRSSDNPSDGSDSESKRPTQSIEVDRSPTPIVPSSEESTDIEMYQPVQSVETRSNRIPVVDSDDEPKEMDWESFIHD
jgi:hypothetical protein